MWWRREIRRASFGRSSRNVICRARYVMPRVGEVVENGAVHVENGRIIEVLDAASSAKVQDKEQNLGNVVLLPGFVNAHSHIEPTFRRNCFDALNLWDWIHRLGFRKGIAPPPETLQASAMLGAAECALSGITCLGDSTFSGAAAAAMDRVGLRGVAYIEVFGQSMGSEYHMKFARRLESVMSLRDNVSSRIYIGISPHAVYTTNYEVLKRTAESYTDMGLRVAIHLAETSAENDYLLTGSGPIAHWRRSLGYEPMTAGVRPTELLKNAGLLRSGVCLAHCVHLDSSEIETIAQSGASVAHCPRSNGYLGAGIAPIRELISAGAVVGLGTDSAASCLRLDMFEEMRTTMLLHRAVAQDAEVLTAKDVLHMATLGGARALGMQEEIGSLEPGKRADMIAIDMSTTLPAEDFYLAIVSKSPADVTMVMVDGNEIVSGGRPVLVDVDECRAELNEI